jgi:predicted TPR repeat methyltransferase
MSGDHINAIKDFRVVFKFYAGSSTASQRELDYRPQSIADDELECATEGLAFSFLEMGDHMQQAERWYHRLIQGNNGSSDRNAKLGSLSLRRTNQAHAGWHTNLGNALFAQGKIDEAVAEFKISVRIDGTRPFAFDGLGRALLTKGRSEDLQKAIDYFRHAVTLRPENALFRQSLAAALSRSGQHEVAATEYASAIKLDGKLAGAYRGLGYCLMMIGRSEDRLAAIGLLQRALALAPQDSESRHFLKVLRSKNTSGSSKAPSSLVIDDDMDHDYARSLFESMASNFEARLIGELGYRGPEIMMQALRDTEKTTKRDNNKNVQYSLERVADLGCGTGLQGPLLKAAGASFIFGVDVSSAMLRKAKTKGCYDDLSEGDLQSALERHTEYSLDLIIATDTFPYVGNLVPIFEVAFMRLRSGGRMAFSVERLDGSEQALRSSLCS